MVHNSTKPLRISLPWCEKLFLCVACKVFLSVVSKCCRCSRGAQRELDEVVSEVFLVCEQILTLLGQSRTTVVVLVIRIWCTY